MDYGEDDIDDDNTILAEGGERYITPDEFANTVSPMQSCTCDEYLYKYTMLCVHT